MNKLVEEFRRELTQHREQKKLAIAAQYGLTLPADVATVQTIYESTEANRFCANCVGECRRKHHAYQQAFVVQEPLGVEWRQCPQRARMEQIRLLELGKQLPARYVVKTWDEYDLTMGNRQAVYLAQKFLSGEVEGLYIHGSCGTGKTFLACLLAKTWYEQGRRFIFGSVPALMTRLQERFNKNGAAELLLDYIDCSLLILDDVGTGNETKWKMEKLFEMIDGRYNQRRRIVLTSNYSPAELSAHWSKLDSDMATKLISRLGQMCTSVKIAGKDRRQYA